jgi:cytochrome c biogenesis protein CcmG/thiol:disulfide interchange protein DsbE
MSSPAKPFWKRDSFQLIALLALAGVITLLFRSSTANVQTPAPLRPVAERKPMANIALPDLAGKLWKLSDHRGQVVLVNVWATWCPPCREETPGLIDLAQEYRGKGFEILGVSADDTTEPVRRFVTQYEVPYPVARPGADSPLIAAVESLPTSFLLDRQGRVAAVFIGAVGRRALAQDVTQLMAER